MAARSKFKYGSRTIPMTMTYSLALNKMSDLGIEVLGVLSDNGRTLEIILLNEKLLLQIWYYYVHEETGDSWEDALAILDETEGGLQQFREDFFALIVNFSSPPSRKYLIETWEQAKRQLKDSRKIRSMISISESPEEPESTSEDTPSEKF